MHPMPLRLQVGQKSIVAFTSMETMHTHAPRGQLGFKSYLNHVMAASWTRSFFL